VAASVAVASILWLRLQGAPDTDSLVVQGAPPASALTAGGGGVISSVSGPESYVVPRKTLTRPSIFPSTQLAKYVVAHSEFSSPVTRRNLLSALMVNESGTAGTSSGSEEPTEDLYDDAKSPQ
jgi:sigma-E factor negative regulatory protein RseA